jgi:hypothetical protein
MELVQTDLWELMLNYVMLLGLDFMPRDQINHMSLNGLRRRVATIDKTQNMTQMHEPLVALDPEHLFSTIGAPTLSFVDMKTICWSISNTRVLVNEA